jgi:hypothetical protein
MALTNGSETVKGEGRLLPLRTVTERCIAIPYLLHSQNRRVSKIQRAVYTDIY